MSRVQAAVFPGALLGCLVVVWVGLALGGLAPAAGSAASGLAVGEDVAVDRVSIEVEDPALATVECSLSARYPEEILRWCALITSSAEGYGMDPNLVAAVMLQESGGNAEVISVSGAVGLMQVMPRDGEAAKFECINGPCFASRPSISELTDPEFNLEYGVRMLAGLYEKKGDWREALKAYGPMDIGYRYADIVLSIYETYRSTSG